MIKDIIAAITKAQEGETSQQTLFESNEPEAKNDFLFFIKPEITLASEYIDLEKILEMILSSISRYKLGIINILLHPAAYLEKHGIIAQHYGVINSIARNASSLNQAAQKNFESLFHIPFNEATVYGGLELKDKYPEFTPKAIDYLWQNSAVIKLGGGIYCQKLQLDGKEIFLINGFHPRQLEHFTANGRSIVTFTLRGNTDWNTARNKFIGKTNPTEAECGSIRNTLLVKKEEFGLQNVSSSWNGVHLSAGPVEGLVELIRYNSDYDRGEIKNIEDFQFGQKLKNEFSKEEIEHILGNGEFRCENDRISVFDLTEERNSDEAIEILRKCLHNA